MSKSVELKKALEDSNKMMEILGYDCKRHYIACKSGSNQPHRRSYVRAVFAYIEGMLHQTKEIARHFGMRDKALSQQELNLLQGLTYEVNDKGKVISKISYMPFKNDFKFAFYTFSKSCEATFEPDLGGQGWESLEKSRKVRDRLMHPKRVEDLEITDIEIKDTAIAFAWFTINLMLSGLHAQKAVEIKTGIKSKRMEVDEEIKKLKAKMP